jgi:hypothetical protein
MVYVEAIVASLILWNSSIPFGVAVAPSTGAAGGGAAAKSVDAAWLTALRRLASDTGDAVELHTNMCSSLLELELEPPSKFFLVYIGNRKMKCSFRFNLSETKY